MARDVAGRIQNHFAGKSQTIDAGIQTANSVRQLDGQHRDNSVDGINAGSALERFTVQKSFRANVIAHVCNVHAQKKSAVAFFGENSIVQIFGVLAVNGHDF